MLTDGVCERSLLPVVSHQEDAHANAKRLTNTNMNTWAEGPYIHRAVTHHQKVSADQFVLLTTPPGDTDHKGQWRAGKKNILKDDYRMLFCASHVKAVSGLFRPV